MSKCVIEQGSIITKDGAFWVINGKTRVSDKDFPSCKWVSPAENPSRIVLQTQELTHPNTIAVSPQSVVVENPHPRGLSPQTSGPEVLENTEFGEIATILKYAGDNIWLVTVIFAYVLAKKYLDSKEKGGAEMKNDLNKQCSDRHMDVSKKLEAMQGSVEDLRATTESNHVGLEQRLASVELETKGLKRKLKPKPQKQGEDSEKNLQ